MKPGGEARGARGEGQRKLGLCVLCGLPAAGKSTFALALRSWLSRERGWAVGVVAYDDVMPDAFLEEAGAGPSPSQWKLLRQELLKYIECFLLAVINGCQMSAPANRTEAMWEGFITCLTDQDLLSSAALQAPSSYLLTKTAISGPLFLILDDNFYYQSMRYEVYQLARKYSLGFCQVFLDCSLETCLQRNGQRPGALPADTIQLMATKIEEPNPKKNAWEHNSLTVRSPARSPGASDWLLETLGNPTGAAEGYGQCFRSASVLAGGRGRRVGFSGASPALSTVCSAASGLQNLVACPYTSKIVTAGLNSPELTDLLLAALENPVKYVEDNVEQKETDRIVCSTNILHQADQTLRRIVSRTMKEAKDEQVPPYKLKLLAEELNKLKAEFLEDLRQGNKKYLCFQHTAELSGVVSFFHYEKDSIVQKYFSKQH